jgi:hypothetical protein
MIFCSLLFASTLVNTPSLSDWTQFASGVLPICNPLKGYAAYLDSTPRLSGHASMAYVEMPWRDLEPDEGHYRFDRLDDKLDRPLAKGKPIVLRIWLDYPARPTGVPKWLRDQGLKMTPYSEYGGGLSPDYENADLKRGLSDFIGALGKRYGENKRVAFVELGLLGHWGEWHTYPRTELFASFATQKLVVDSMQKAFPHTHLLGRYPDYKALEAPWMGFHDDMIPDDTDAGPDWNFLPKMIAGGMASNWKVAPMGGEMTPFNAKRLLTKDWGKLTSAVKKGHFTFIAGYCPVIEQNVDLAFKHRSDDLARLLGYSFRLERANFPHSAARSRVWRFEIEAANVGVAPFYYQWPVQLAMLRPDGVLAQAVTLKVDIRSWLPGKFTVRGSVDWRVPPGAYQLAIGVLDPSTSKPCVRFANRLEVVKGWTILSKHVLLNG